MNPRQKRTEKKSLALTDNNQCFACGHENKSGLKLLFSYSRDGEKVSTTFTPDARFQGWEGVVHGGIIVTLLDEVMAKAALHKGFTVITGEISTKFKAPARIREQLRCEAEIESVSKKIIYTKATAYNNENTVIAQASSKMFIAAS